MSRILQVFLENESALKRYLGRFFPRADDIDDIAQETFLKAFAAESRQDIHAPKAFLFRIAKNTALNEISKKSRTSTEYIEDSGPLDVLEDDSQVPVDDQVCARQKLGAFSDAVASLPTQCRRVFLLRKVYGLSHKEIAERQGISVSTVEKHLANGLLKCSQYLRRQGHLLEDFGVQQNSKGATSARR